jgi:hypothetical protein
MAIHLLTARQVQAATDGDHGDGAGLVLKVRAGQARWLFRFTSPAGVRRAMGLGAAHRDSTAAAGPVAHRCPRCGGEGAQATLQRYRCD